ncbi:MAG: low molecular weight phosphotyrosine protein phosphatase [Kiritimatiellae bacterium]|nr:low molecular weight phosphotyrosine protein phosphatase [Kiritimatiellia bacterium]
MCLLFVCHGNICRSPMAEFVMADLIRKAGLEGVTVESAALHTDEIGNDIHYGTRAKLIAEGIPFAPRRAWLLTAQRAHGYDLLIGMDRYNIADLKRLVYPEDRPKIHRLLAFTPSERDIADPWYTDDFEATYRDVLAGCTALIKRLSGDGRTGERN